MILLGGMTKVYLLLGSNEGNREQNMLKAIQLIELRCGALIKRSGLYETEAWGLKEQGKFLNQAILIDTNIPATTLLGELKTIEKETGRVETVKWGPRVIDIDILFYGNEIIDTTELKVPHPYIQERRFTLVPLNEIAAELVHPVFNKPIVRLLEECKDNSSVSRFVDLG
ncbi:MAG: folK [Bacteroidota bacterium]|nr:folK [Bacteroidota bacterium]